MPLCHCGKDQNTFIPFSFYNAPSKPSIIFVYICSADCGRSAIRHYSEWNFRPFGILQQSKALEIAVSSECHAILLQCAKEQATIKQNERLSTQWK
jgi:hypothetical protein